MQNLLLKGKDKVCCYLGNCPPKDILFDTVYKGCSLWAVYYFVVCLGFLCFVTEILKFSTWMKPSGITTALSLISKLFRQQHYPMGKAQTTKTPASWEQETQSVPTFSKVIVMSSSERFWRIKRQQKGLDAGVKHVWKSCEQHLHVLPH